MGAVSIGAGAEDPGAAAGAGADDETGPHAVLAETRIAIPSSLKRIPATGIAVRRFRESDTGGR